MATFTQADIDHLLADLQLYSGNIRSIDGLFDCHPPGGSGGFGGKIHTSMDTFNFSVIPLLCDEESWTILLVDPVAAIRCGGSIRHPFRFPKLHKDQALQERYALANMLHNAYHGYSEMPETNRLSRHEKALGYESLPSCQHVLDAILRDFRSYQEKRQEETRAGHTNN